MEEELLKHIQYLQEIIAANIDHRTKEIGDRVIVWDGSGNLDKDTLKHRRGIDPLFSNTAIVIKTNCNVLYEDGEFQKRLDLLLVFPNGEHVYTHSDYVKIVD